MSTSYAAGPPQARRFRLALTPFLQDPGLPFANVLTEEQVEEAFRAEGASFGQSEDAIYTPAVTLWAFLSQMLYTDQHRACAAAVKRAAVFYSTLGREISENTGAYCRARAKLPEAVLRRLALDAGRRLEDSSPPDWLWFGRHVKLVDGTCITAPDTAANRKVYPQPPSQKPGLGFPMLRLVVVISLATAALGALAFGPYEGEETGESSLLRRVLDSFQPGEILLADRTYCAYLLLALAGQRQVDWVVRLHQARHPDFRRGVCRGIRDLVVTWERPRRPPWMDEATYATIPERMQVREIRIRVDEPGFRPDEIVVVTSLLDTERYPMQAVAELYHYRWYVELDIRAIKQFTAMDHLRCKNPAMVHRELWVHWLAYNLIRKSIAQAAMVHGRAPRRLSYTGAQQTLAASWDRLTTAGGEQRLTLAQTQLRMIAQHIVPDRPGRVEPRAIKSVPSHFPRLMEPRPQARRKLYRHWALR